MVRYSIDPKLTCIASDPDPQYFGPSLHFKTLNHTNPNYLLEKILNVKKREQSLVYISILFILLS